MPEHSASSPKANPATASVGHGLANLLTQWARLLIGSLVRAGVEQVVISPGSRSTPLVAAILDSAARDTGVQFSVVIDERSAAFFALGQAKCSGKPSLLVCTSGSALAHYHPAVVEAQQSNTPLLVLSADRPAALQGNRAAQTIDQSKFFSDHVRGFFELGAADPNPTALMALQRKATQAFALSCHPLPGPVHLNFPAAKPLEPAAAGTPAETALEDHVARLLAQPLARGFAGRVEPEAQSLHAIADLLTKSERPALVLGPMAAQQHGAQALIELCRAAEWPVLCETTSQQRVVRPEAGAELIDGFDWLYRACVAVGSSSCQSFVPDLVVRFGSTPTSAALERVLSSAGSRQLVVAPHEWSDPTNQAQLMIAADPDCVARALRSLVRPASSAWRDRLRDANRTIWAQVDAVLAQQPAFGDPVAVRTLLASLEADDLLVIGNSLPVRLVDLVAPASSAHFTCLSQRGANGIDGLISTTAGAASQRAGRTLALVGDVSALHDIGGLYALSQSSATVVVVVLNNGGGRIFEQLPIAAGHSDLSPWTTPHTVDISRVASAYGVRAFAVDDVASLEQGLNVARAFAGPSLIEAKTESNSAADFQRAVVKQLVQTLRLDGA